MIVAVFAHAAHADAGGSSIGFFEPAYVALPAGIAGIIFLSIFATRILPRHTGLFGVVRDKTSELLTEVEVGPTHDLLGRPVALLMARFNVSTASCTGAKSTGAKSTAGLSATLTCHCDVCIHVSVCVCVCV